MLTKINIRFRGGKYYDDVPETNKRPEKIMVKKRKTIKKINQ